MGNDHEYDHDAAAAAAGHARDDHHPRGANLHVRVSLYPAHCPREYGTPTAAVAVRVYITFGSSSSLPASYNSTAVALVVPDAEYVCLWAEKMGLATAGPYGWSMETVSMLCDES